MSHPIATLVRKALFPLAFAAAFVCPSVASADHTAGADIEGDEETIELLAKDRCAYGGIKLFEHKDFNQTSRGFKLVECAKQSGWRTINLANTSYNDRVSSFRTFGNVGYKRPKVMTFLDRPNDATARRFTRKAAKRVEYVGDPRNDKITAVRICAKNCKL